MKWGYLTLLAALAPHAFGSTCIEGQGESKTETRAQKAFESVLVKGSFDVEIHKGGEPRVEISGPANLVAIIRTVLEGNQLVLRSEGCFKSTKDLKIAVYGNNLKALTLEGSADIKLFDALGPDASKIDLSGSGDIEGDIKTSSLDLSIKGSGDMKLKGSADKLRVSIKGSGDLQAQDLTAKDVGVEISGSGDATVLASDALDVNIRGSGDVRYKGDPKVKNVNTRGSGSVDKL